MGSPNSSAMKEFLRKRKLLPGSTPQQMKVEFFSSEIIKLLCAFVSPCERVGSGDETK